MVSNLVALLESLKYPVFLQGTLNPDEPYPDSFFTFWNQENDDDSFYSGKPLRAIWTFFIYFYSADPQLVETVSESARQLLKANGYIVQGKPSGIYSDKSTHTGAVFSTYVFQNYESTK